MKTPALASCGTEECVRRAQDDRRKDRSERLRIISFTSTSLGKFKVVKDAIQVVGEYKLAGKERF